MTNEIRVLVLGTNQHGEDCYWVIAVEVSESYIEDLSEDDNAHLMAAMIAVRDTFSGEPVLAVDDSDALTAGLFLSIPTEYTVSVDVWHRMSAADQLAFRGILSISASSMWRCSPKDEHNGLSADTPDTEAENLLRCLWHTNMEVMLLLTEVLRAVQGGNVTTQTEITAQYILTKLGAE